MFGVGPMVDFNLMRYRSGVVLVAFLLCLQMMFPAWMAAAPASHSDHMPGCGMSTTTPPNAPAAPLPCCLAADHAQAVLPATPLAIAPGPLANRVVQPAEAPAPTLAPTACLHVPPLIAVSLRI